MNAVRIEPACRLRRWILALVLGAAGPTAALEMQVQPRHGFGGQEVTLHLTLADLPEDRPTEGRASLHAFDARIASARFSVPAAAPVAEVYLSLPLPGVRRPLAAKLRLTLGQETAEASVGVFPRAEEAARPAFASREVAFVDLPEAASLVARAVGSQAVFLSTTSPLPAETRVLVLPAVEEVLAGRARWIEAARQGRTLLLIGGRKGARWGDLPWVATSAPVEAAAPTHPLFDEASAEWLNGWIQGPALGLTLPAQGNFRALTFSGSEHLAASLMEWPLGQGWVLACSRPLLEALTEEPPAASLLSALVRYAATLSAAPFARKPVVALADPQGDAARWLHELDVTAATRLPLGTPSAVVIVDAKSVPQETLRAMTQRTDARTVVLLGLDPASLAALEPLCPAGLRLESEAHDIGSGLGPAPPPETKSSTSSDPLWWGITDRMLRCAVADGRVYRLRPLEETSGRFLEGGLGGLWEKEGRRVVGWQAPLNNPWGRAAFCQLLTNLGAELPNE